jgi:hypothetical protein
MCACAELGTAVLLGGRRGGEKGSGDRGAYVSPEGWGASKELTYVVARIKLSTKVWSDNQCKF